MAASTSLFPVPKSSETVKVSIIDSTTRLFNISTQILFHPPIPGYELLEGPTFSFLIEHKSGVKYLFDLAVRKDWSNLAPALAKTLKDYGFEITVEKGVHEILEEHGIKSKDINAIIWSHHHWDHTGDPSTFPSSTELIVGPGFKDAYLPGYPRNPEGIILESDYSGRTLREISFDTNGPKIGNFHAFDMFNDGSFYLLDAPGHTIGHICALARTTVGQNGEGDTFIFTGADACHHGGEFRPSPHLPLPDSITPHPFVAEARNAQICPGAMFEKIHPVHDSSKTEGVSDWRSTPFFQPGPATHNMEDTVKTIHRLQEADAGDRVFTIMAHDESLVDIIEYFPEHANDWYKKGWARDGKWRFLRDFQKAVDAGYEAPGQ